MALLQISEPGDSPEPHQRKLAAGIDLGTTHSLVATVRSGTAEILADSEGRPLLPSIVRYSKEGKVVVGYDARAAQADDPANTIVSVKRFMGRGVADVARYGALPYRFTDTPGMLNIETVAGARSPVQVSAEILPSGGTGQPRHAVPRFVEHPVARSGHEDVEPIRCHLTFSCEELDELRRVAFMP